MGATGSGDCKEDEGNLEGNRTGKMKMKRQYECYLYFSFLYRASENPELVYLGIRVKA